jgi:hypothetical protein
MDGASYIINAATTTPFPASTTITAKNLAVNGSITLNTPVTVNGTMTLNAGNILTTSTAGLLTLGPAANFIGGSSTSFINGPLQLTNSSVSQTTFVFPIGKETSYRPVSLTLTQNSTTPTTYKAEVFNTPPINRNLPSTLDRISFVRYFNIIKGAGANVSSAQITINYDVTGIDDGVTNATNLRLAKDDGLGNWIDLGGDNTSINFTGSITPSGSLTTFGDFTLANNSGGSNLLGGQVPVQPLPVNPANLTVNVPINITLVWGNSTGAATYRLLVATDPGFSNIILDDSTLTDITRPVGPLQNNTKYYWKINGKNFLGTGVFSTTFNFTTIVSIPGIPVLATPSNGTVNQPLRPTLTWNSVPLSESYRVQVSTDSAFNSLIVNDSLVTATSLLISPLSGFSKYYWKVKAVNVAGTGGYSAPFNFMTVLSAPQLLLPTNGETQGFTWQHFIWSPVNGAVSYHFQLAKDSIFSVIVVDDSALIVDTAEAKLLTLNTKYYWRVLAKNPQSQSDYSTIFNFIAAITGINDKTGTTPNVYNLYQNYPNPFNPSTVIRYDLPNESVVNLQLYNSIGQLVKVLISSPQSAGVHDITFNSSGLSSGVYIYTLSAKPVSGGQQFRFIKKMLLLK